MRVTALQEYGLRCILQIASHKEIRPLPVREIAKRERLTPVYVEKILVNLRRAALVRSLRGVNGGYAMAWAPKDVSVCLYTHFRAHRTKGEPRWRPSL